MGYSDKDIIIISVCLFTLTVAIVMYFALCVNHVYRRRCKLRGVTQDLPKDAKLSISKNGMTNHYSGSSQSIKTISQQPTGRHTFVIAKERDIIDLSKRQTRRESIHTKRLASKKEEDRIDRSKRHSRRVSGHQKTPACNREEEERINLSICYTRREGERQIKLTRKEEEKEEMNVVYKFKTRRLSEHQKQVACNREDEEDTEPPGKRGVPYSFDAMQMSADLIKAQGDQPILLVPPPPPDPPNPQ